MLRKELVLVLLAGLIGAGSVQASGFLADRHVARKMTCETCHVGTAVKKNKKELEVCADCHGDYDAMYKKHDAKYKKMEMENPHGQHDGNLPCSACHKGHKPSKNYCLECHNFDFKVP
ncbi:MAG: cytochrome c3 family protein [Duodenibacillus sp.]|jgi:fumarate reductase flavoprotein subunit|nr:cytochrome c3 family protein [Duodenibacillus sp.]